jgi:hypothetical protein
VFLARWLVTAHAMLLHSVVFSLLLTRAVSSVSDIFC